MFQIIVKKKIKVKNYNFLQEVFMPKLCPEKIKINQNC